MFGASFISGFRDFTRHLTSGILRVRLIIEIWIQYKPSECNGHTTQLRSQKCSTHALRKKSRVRFPAM